MPRRALGAFDCIARAIIREECPEPGDFEEHISSNNFASQRRIGGTGKKRPIDSYPPPGTPKVKKTI
jgi:hypothetical protein